MKLNINYVKLNFHEEHMKNNNIQHAPLSILMQLLQQIQQINPYKCVFQKVHVYL